MTYNLSYYVKFGEMMNKMILSLWLNELIHIYNQFMVYE